MTRPELSREGDLRCPSCEKSDGLWLDVELSGWRAINPDGSPGYEQDADWHFVTELSTGGCTCGWEGSKDEMRLPPLGLDGRPLPEIHPGQETIDA